jgi:hypothetical protein
VQEVNGIKVKMGNTLLELVYGVGIHGMSVAMMRKKHETSFMKEQAQMIKDCLLRADNLSEWEFEFVTDLKSKASWGRKLSESQLSKLSEIWEIATEDG